MAIKKKLRILNSKDKILTKTYQSNRNDILTDTRNISQANLDYYNIPDSYDYKRYHNDTWEIKSLFEQNTVDVRDLPWISN
jgi:hypothetical protein